MTLLTASLNLLLSSTGAAELAPQCSSEKIASLLASPTFEDGRWLNRIEKVDCRAKLPLNSVVTKQLEFSTPGASLDCNGSTISPPKALLDLKDHDTISVTSRFSLDDEGNRNYIQVKDILIENCDIHGEISISANNFTLNEAVAPDDFSNNYGPEIVELWQQTHPRNIIFNNIKLVNEDYPGAIHLYPGVHEVKIYNSDIYHRDDNATIYMSPEGGGHEIIGNNFYHRSGSWIGAKQQAVIMMDGSANNTVKFNKFDFSVGAVHLFRNCGERGDSRYQGAWENNISHNVFLSDWNISSLVIGLRDGDSPGLGDYCDLDSENPLWDARDVPFYFDWPSDWEASSSNDLDFARNNLVEFNLHCRRPSGGSQYPTSRIKNEGHNMGNIVRQEVAKYESDCDHLFEDGARLTAFEHMSTGNTYNYTRYNKFGLARLETNDDLPNVIYSDFNGDGVDDVYFPDKNLVSLRNVDPSTGFIHYQSSHFDSGQIYINDDTLVLAGKFNSDQYDDLVVLVPWFDRKVKYFIYVSDGTKFQANGVGYLDNYSPNQKYFFTNVEGDSRYELIRTYAVNGAPRIMVNKPLANSFEYSSFTELRGFIGQDAKVLFADVDRNGRKDYVQVNNFDGRAHVSSYLSKERGFEPALHTAKNLAGFSSAQNWLACDFDGDGDDDLINIYGNGHRVVYWRHNFENGNFEYQSEYKTISNQRSDDFKVAVANLDADNRCDLVRLDGTDWEYRSDRSK